MLRGFGLDVERKALESRSLQTANAVPYDTCTTCGILRTPHRTSWCRRGVRVWTDRVRRVPKDCRGLAQGREHRVLRTDAMCASRRV